MLRLRRCTCRSLIPVAVLRSARTSLGYTFVPGYSYFVTINYNSTTSYTVLGVGLSLGQPQWTTNYTLLGSALSQYFTSGSGLNFLDDFLAGTFYSEWLAVYSNAQFTNAYIPSFTVSANTTGLNLESLPTTQLQIEGVNQGDQLCEGDVFNVYVPYMAPDATGYVWNVSFLESSAQGLIGG